MLIVCLIYIINESDRKIKAGNIDLSEDEIIELLRINNFSSEYYDLLAASNAYISAGSSGTGDMWLRK